MFTTMLPAIDFIRTQIAQEKKKIALKNTNVIQDVSKVTHRKYISYQ